MHICANIGRNLVDYDRKKEIFRQFDQKKRERVN